MEYKNLTVKWRVFDYIIEDEVTVKIFEAPLQAAIFCIDNHHAGVEMIAFKK